MLLEQNKAYPVLFLASGGSSLAILNHINTSLLDGRVTLSVTDDRFSFDPNVNNFAQIMALPFYLQAKQQGCSFIDTRPLEGESAEQVGERFNQKLKEWMANNSTGKVIITQGIGPDSHTCGMMPYPEDPKRFNELFENPSVWAIGYNAGSKNEYPERITVTMPFLRHRVSEAVVFVAGKAKRPILANIATNKGALAAVPVMILNQMPKVQIYTDISFEC